MANPKKPAEPAKAASVKDNQLKLEGDRNRRWWLYLDPTQTMEDLRRPSFVGQLAAKLIGNDPRNPIGLWDEVVALKRSTGEISHFHVVDLAPNHVALEAVAYRPPDATALPPDCPFTLRWNEGARCHEVMRAGHDGGPPEVMSTGHLTPGRAVKWITDTMEKAAPIKAAA